MTALDDCATESRLEEANQPRLPVFALLALAFAGFITILTETLPAGLLPEIGHTLHVTQPAAGQLVTVYALGSMVAAIPLATYTSRWHRRTALLIGVTGFGIANAVTAASTNYALTLAARFIAGVVAGLVWAILVGYARRMVPEAQQGRALAIAMTGTPVALAGGVPAATFLGTAIGWQLTFGIVSVLTVLLIGWILLGVPDYPGEGRTQRTPIRQAVRRPGVPAVLAVTVLYVLAHNILYTYIADVVRRAHLASHVDLVLLVFGITAFIGIAIIGVLIDQHLRQLVLTAIALFIAAALLIGVQGTHPVTVYLAVAIWGLSFGGTATLFLTAAAHAATDAADVVHPIVVTIWNAAIAAGGILGGVILDTAGTRWFSWTLLALLVPCLAIAVRARGSGFPPPRPASHPEARSDPTTQPQSSAT